jgi:hypothetical protein
MLIVSRSFFKRKKNSKPTKVFGIVAGLSVDDQSISAFRSSRRGEERQQ